MPELRHLRSFVTVAEDLHFGRAADRLHLTQTAVSAHVRQLEAELGVTLLDRTTRRVTLTAAGRSMLEDARNVLAGADALWARAGRSQERSPLTIRAGYTNTVGYAELPRMLAAVHGSGMVLKARAMIAADIPSSLLAHRIDVGLLRHPPLVDGLVGRMIAQEEQGVMLGVGRRFAQRETIALSELASEPLVLWPRELAPGYYDASIATCRAAGFEPQVVEGIDPGVRIGLDHFAIASGRGFALTPMSAAPILAGAGIRVLGLDPPVAPLPLTLLHRAAEPLDGAVARFSALVGQRSAVTWGAGGQRAAASRPRSRHA